MPSLELFALCPNVDGNFFRTILNRSCPIKEINTGDLLITLAGEKIVLDGVVVEGFGSCDESLLTGESIPSSKNLGDKVLAGSILQQGKIVHLVQKKAEDSTLQKIISIVEQDITNKERQERVTDKIVHWFIPSVLGLAFVCIVYCLVFEITDNGLTSTQTALYRSIALLLISCPCAIGIAIPLVESRLIHAMAELGAIIRNRTALRYLGRETYFLFDKTGTLTKGQFVLIEGLESIPSFYKPLLKGLAGASIHPLSKAVFEAIEGKHYSPEYIEDSPGQGVAGAFPDGRYFLGSQKFLETKGCKCLPFLNLMENVLLTVIYFGKTGEVAYPLALGDQLRESAPAAIKALNAVLSMVISGDSPQVTSRVAQMSGIENWKAYCSPQNKRDVVTDLKRQGHVVAMVGDGINDATALAAAHIGLTVVNAADLSIQTSDILLTTESLQTVADLRTLAIKGRSIIAQNLFWAFSYNVVGLFLAFCGELSPLYAAFAMVTSSLFVILNAKRI